jgi:hypothetical protein
MESEKKNVADLFISTYREMEYLCAYDLLFLQILNVQLKHTKPSVVL